MSLNVLVATPSGNNPDSAGTASGDAREHSADGVEAWSARIAIARQSGHPEDLQVLADEAPSADLRAAAQLLADEVLQQRRQRNSPDKVFLFAGHMIDTLERPIARFPPDKESLAAAHVVREVTRRSGQVTWLDTRELW